MLWEALWWYCAQGRYCEGCAGGLATDDGAARAGFAPRMPCSNNAWILVHFPGRLCELEGYYPQSSNVLRMLGYFSLTGLMRVHCLVGDYYTALKVGAVLPRQAVRWIPHGALQQAGIQVSPLRAPPAPAGHLPAEPA